MTRAYRGESADEWMHITCPDDCIPRERHEREYDADSDPDWTPSATLPPMYWATVDGHLKQITAGQYAAIYGRS